jgi:peptidoglycan/xylan/chitin deacetylase (PgdA/CDA1 family)
VRLPGALRLRRLARCAVQRVAPGSLILLYHRVAEAEGDPWSLCVSPRRFAEHLEVLGERVRPLAQLTGSRRSGRGCVAITFDDGYADALHAAHPLLARRGAPATVFVATGGVDGGGPFWWDQLAALVAPQRALPARLELRVRGRLHRFESDPEAGAGSPGRVGGAGFGAWPAPRARLHHALHRLLGSLGAAEREEQLAALDAWAGAAAAGPGERALGREEIAKLAAGGLVEIGAHSVSHARLTELSADDREWEIRESQAFLADLLGRPVTSFAYPHGRHDAATRRVLESAGFERACTSRSGSVRPRTDALELPRVGVPDCDGEGFARLLHRFGF